MKNIRNIAFIGDTSDIPNPFEHDDFKNVPLGVLLDINCENGFGSPVGFREKNAVFIKKERFMETGTFKGFKYQSHFYFDMYNSGYSYHLEIINFTPCQTTNTPLQK